MTCGLAEEETRLVTSRSVASIARRRLAFVSWCSYLAVIRERRIYDALELRDCFRKPRIRDRPQTACGRYCPWEPTALKVERNDSAFEPSRVTATVDGYG